MRTNLRTSDGARGQLVRVGPGGEPMRTTSHGYPQPVTAGHTRHVRGAQSLAGPRSFPSASGPSSLSVKSAPRLAFSDQGSRQGSFQQHTRSTTSPNNSSLSLGIFADLPPETLVQALKSLDSKALGAVDCTSLAWSARTCIPERGSIRRVRQPLLPNSILGEVVAWHLEERLDLPPLSMSFRRQAKWSWMKVLSAAEAVIHKASPEALAQIRLQDSQCRQLRLRQHSIFWDARRGSPECVTIGGGLEVSKGVSDPRYPWHAAITSTELDVRNSCLVVRFVVEHAGTGIMEIGIVTNPNSARLAALHWPGLRDTCAFTFANTGQRFWNIPGASEEIWCQPYGQAYTAGDIIDLELSGNEAAATLRFSVNGNPQGSLISHLPVHQHYWVGATLSDHACLRLLSSRIYVLEAGQPSTTAGDT